MPTKTKTRRPSTKRTRARKTPGKIGRSRELSGLFFAVSGLAALLGLLSVSRPRNWVGPVGDFLAKTLLSAFGIGAYPIVIGLLVVSVFWLLGRKIHLSFVESICGFGLFLSSLVLIALFVPTTFQEHPPGGHIGASLQSLLVSLFSTIGSTILAGALLISCFAILADIELKRILQWVGRSGKLLATPVIASLERAQEAVQDAREAREIAHAELAAEREERLREHVEALKSQALVEDDEEEDWNEEPLTHKPLIQNKTTSQIKEPLPSEDKNTHSKPQNRQKVSTERQENTQTTTKTQTDQKTEQRDPQENAKVHEVSPAEILSENTLTPVSTKDAGKVNTLKNPPGLSSIEPTIVEPKFRPKPIPEEETPRIKQDEYKEFELPPLSFFEYKEPSAQFLDKAILTANAKKLEQKLLDYHVPGKVMEIHPGPVITLYEFAPGPGIKVSKIAGLSDDLAMALEAERVRIIAPIPGKSVVGIEIPNAKREIVYLKEILADTSFQKANSKLTLGLGKMVDGTPKVTNLAKMPHLLVAGATGSGKSVAVNTMICSILYNATPEEVRFLMVDPKMLELSIYDGIPHLLLPVVTDMKKAALALRWAVDEMERRYQLLAEAGVRNIANYNKKLEQQRKDLLEGKIPRSEEPRSEEPIHSFEENDAFEVPEALPYIVVIIDELADLMMVASRDVETSIARLAQMARAAGIHLILATQRPSVDVITGLIKANFPTRISFQVASKIDSRTILDQQGAENLLGMGDMLMMERGKLMRLHGALVLEEEIHKIVDFLKEQGTPQYDEEILAPRDEDGGKTQDPDEVQDILYDQAVAIVADARQASTSMIQRKLRIGYNRAARLIEKMEKEGIVGPPDGSKPREVLIQAIE